RARPSLQVRGGADGRNRGDSRARGRARPRARVDPDRRGARCAADVHGDAGAPRPRRPPRLRQALLGGRCVKVVIGHLFPDYLNIYADRGNMAVLAKRAAWRGHELDVAPIGAGATIRPGEHDLFYVGGGQDREQELIAPALAALGRQLRECVKRGAAVLAVCGGYQLLGRFYRAQSGRELPGISGFGNDGTSGYEGCRVGRAIGTYLHGPLLPRNPWLADWLLAQALACRSGEVRELDPLPDELEAEAHVVSAERARARGGRY